MKTIFIPIFQGIEAKNILRTDIFNILRGQPYVRIVLFVSNQEKKEYFSREFFGDNIIYEVLEKYKQPGLNRFFTFLKYNLLNTHRMDIRRRVELTADNNYLKYYLKLIFNRIFARPTWRRLTRWLDFKLVKDNNFKEIFDKYRPDLVLLAHLFGDVEISMLREAKKRNIISVGLINSWDKITSRCIIRLLPNKLIVHNNIIKAEALEHVDIAGRDIEIVGIPHYDMYISRQASPKEVFYKKICTDINRVILLFCPTGQFFSDIDAEMINIISDLQVKKLIPADMQILLRFPPNDAVDLTNLKNKDKLIIQQPGVRFSKKRGIDWDMNDADNQHLLDTLYYSSLVVCPPSSMSVDAAVFDKPVINLKFRRTKEKYTNQNINLFYDTDHYKKIIDTGGVKVVHDEQELLTWINKYLADPAIDRAGRQRIVHDQCWRLDGQAGKRAVHFLLNLIK